MMKKIPIAIARGDGIGPEIMDAVLAILFASKANIDIHEVEIGEKVYLRGESCGIEPKTWDVIRKTKAFLKAPITTPQGGGFKSLNVTVRTVLGLFANIRPCVAYNPFVKTKHPNMDVVVIRENEEDLYTGIEYRQSQDTVHALKIISRPGSEKIIRYAFEFAKAQNRKKVTCFSKDNILKLTDGLFHKIFDEIAKEYPEIENEHWIVDIGAAKLADTPEVFDVIVMPNLYGDILSDVAAQIAGSVGLAGSANIGPTLAMFEAIHGSAPRRAGQNLANPSGLLLAAVMMLAHIGEPKLAETIHNAWLKTLEDGIHTYDIYKEGISREKVGTKEFAEAVIQRLNQKPKELKPVHYRSMSFDKIGQGSKMKRQKKELVGVDVFIDSEHTLDLLKDKLEKDLSPLSLSSISNRGVTAWPNPMPETFFIDNWRARFVNKKKGEPITPQDIVDLLKKITDRGLEFVHTESLFNFDGKPGYNLAQNE